MRRFDERGNEMRERLTVCVAQIDLIDSLELGDVLVDYFIIGIIIVSIINFLLLLFFLHA